ncbi:MAG: DUF4920 domain-containing protein [Archangium sp.]|nr:DUF4920 domain-containing protein [Archangium sp.]
MNTLLLALLLTCTPDGKGGMTCNHQHKAGETAAAGKEADCNHPEPAATTTAAAATMLRGEKLKGAQSVDLGKLLASPSDFDGKTVAIEAKVRKACEKKGCWMEVAAADKGPGMRVTFKDYGFFVPLDSAGSTVKVEGVVKVAMLDDAKAKHLEAEGATVPKGKDGKYREVQLVAVGLELRK